jgi:small subunit ribosomal protein S2
MVIDAKYERNAVAEARKLNIPVVSVVDTDSNPDSVDIVIPGNDDSLRGIQIILRYICDGIREGVELERQGQGLRDKGGLQVSTYDDFGPSGREKRRQRPERGGEGGGGRGRGGRPSGGPRTEEQTAEVAGAADEAVAVAESQGNRGPKAQVRVKPRAADVAAPAADAPAPAAE